MYWIRHWGAGGGQGRLIKKKTVKTEFANDKAARERKGLLMEVLFKTTLCLEGICKEKIS